MKHYAVLEITNGEPSNTVNLLNPATGIHLTEWKTKVVPSKVVSSESPLVDGGKVVHRRFSNVKETFEFDIDGLDPDEIAIEIWKLMQIMEQSMGYHVSSSVDKCSYIRMKPALTDKYHYGVIYDYSMPNLGNLMEQPFSTNGMVGAALTSLTLEVTRGHWLPNKPHEPAHTPCGSYGDRLEVPVTSRKVTSAAYGIHYDSVSDVVVVGGNAVTYRSANKGSSWTTSAAHNSGLIRTIFMSSTGVWFAGGDGTITRSTDGGLTWSNATTLPNGQVTSIWEYQGKLYAGEMLANPNSATSIYRSTNLNGSSWSAISTLPSGLYSGGGVAVGDVILAGDYRSTDGGLTWSMSSSGWIGLGSMVKLDSGRVMSLGPLGGVSRVWATDDKGITWKMVRQPSGGIAMVRNPYVEGEMLLSPSSTFYGTLKLHRSGDYGATFGLYTTTTVISAIPYMDRLQPLPNNTILFTCVDGVYLINRNTSDMDISSNQKDGYPIINRYRPSRVVTSILYYDASTSTYINIPNVAPFSLFGGVVPASGDYIYMCLAGNSFSLPMDNLAFNFSQVPSVFMDWTMQVYAGGSWTDAELKSTTSSYDDKLFGKLGLGVISWEVPSDIGTVSVNGSTQYWVRFVVPTSTISASDLLVQSSVPIYTSSTNWANVKPGDVKGNVTALMRMRIINVSDKGGRIEAERPIRPINRVVCGVRSYSRGDQFTSRISMYSTESNVPGIVIGYGSSTTAVASATEPLGGYAVFNPSAAEGLLSRVSLTLDNYMSKQWSGRFKAFLRVHQVGGAAGDMWTAIQIGGANGSTDYRTESVYTRSVYDNEVLEFSPFKIKSGNIGDDVYISIMAGSSSGTPDLRIKELALIPVDEWAMDSKDMVNTLGSILGADTRSYYPNTMLDIDSASQFKRGLKSTIKYDSVSEFDNLSWMTSAPSPAVLTPHTHQRIFFLFLTTRSVSTDNPIWMSNPRVLCTLKINTHGCYLGIIGDNT